MGELGSNYREKNFVTVWVGKGLQQPFLLKMEDPKARLPN